jgi:hypothetical protein
MSPGVNSRAVQAAVQGLELKMRIAACDFEPPDFEPHFSPDTIYYS